MKTIIINNYRPKPKLCFSFMKIHENIYFDNFIHQPRKCSHFEIESCNFIQKIYLMKMV